MALVKLATIQVVDGRYVAGESSVQLDTVTGDLHALGGVVTADGGFAVPMINKTGAPSVKGTPVTASAEEDNAFKVETSQYAVIGYVYEDGIADGEECLIVKSGKAKVLLEDDTTATRGHLIRASITQLGRVNSVVPAEGIGAQTTADHFKEAGHCLEDNPGGVDQLVLASLHSN